LYLRISYLYLYLSFSTCNVSVWQVHVSEVGQCGHCLCHCTQVAPEQSAGTRGSQHHWWDRRLDAWLRWSRRLSVDASYRGEGCQHPFSKNLVWSTSIDVGLGSEAGTSCWLKFCFQRDSLLQDILFLAWTNSSAFHSGSVWWRPLLPL